MGVGTFFHYFGTVLLLAATALLIVVSVTAPVVNDLSILKVDVDGNNSVDRITFGTFGWCVIGNHGAPTHCSKAHVGYNPIDAFAGFRITFNNDDDRAAKVLTRVLILHPIAAGLTFLAFLLCLGTSFCGSLVASLFSFLAFVVTLVAMACDFAAFSLVKHNVNTRGTNLDAHWGAAVWCILVAAVLTLIATVLVFVTCCAGRRKKEHVRRSKADY